MFDQTSRHHGLAKWTHKIRHYSYSANSRKTEELKLSCKHDKVPRAQSVQCISHGAWKVSVLTCVLFNSTHFTRLQKCPGLLTTLCMQTWAFKSDRPRLKGKSRLYHVLVVEPWARSVASLSLSLHICKRRVMTSILQEEDLLWLAQCLEQREALKEK